MSLPVNWVWTPERTEVLRRMYAEGVPDTEIAEELGRTKQAIYCKRQKMGLTIKSGTVRTMPEYSTGQLLDALKSRGYVVRIMKRPGR